MTFIFGTQTLTLTTKKVKQWICRTVVVFAVGCANTHPKQDACIQQGDPETNATITDFDDSGYWPVDVVA